MRRLIAWAPAEHEERLVEAARRHGGEVTLLLDGRGVARAGEEARPGERDEMTAILTHVPNEAVSRFVDDLDEVDGVRISLLPQGAFGLGPPAESLRPSVADVSLRSPLEIVLASLQSLGSWKGFLAYAAASGAVVWVGFFTNTVYLLVAGMLISPLAGPAMNGALATARGDLEQLGRSVARYLAALAVGATVAALLTLAFGLSIATTLMTDISSISVAAVVLPLVAGAAGALTLAQSERSSLVSGAATGMLVAAALAPPMGLLGMSVVLGIWELVASAGFLLGLQLVGINLAGSLVFRLTGVGPGGLRYARGSGTVRSAATVVTLLAIGGFLTWQFLTVPSLQRETLAREAETVTLETLERSDDVRPVEVTARYTRADITGQNTILVQVFAQVEEGVDPSPELEDELTRAIANEVDEAVGNTTPLVNVTLLEPR